MEKTKSFVDMISRIVNDVRLNSEYLMGVIKSLFSKTEIDPFLRKSNVKKMTKILNFLLKF